MRAGRAATVFSREPLRGDARERPDRACWAGRRTRIASAALVEGKDRRRPSGLISGEPGIGKSRLTAALLERLAPSRTRGLRYFCSPQHTDSALYPIISHMERAAALRTTIPRKRSSRNWMPCWRGVLRHARTRRCLPKCCRCRTTDVIRRSNWPRSSGGRKRWRR